MVSAVRKPTERACARMAEDGSKHWLRVTKANTPVQDHLKQIATYHNGHYTRIEDPGHLRDSIDLRELRVYYSVPHAGMIYEQGVDTNVSYAPYVEEGTGLWGPLHAKYRIRPRNPAGWLSWITRKPVRLKSGRLVPAGTRMFAKEVLHPGSPGQHMFAIGAAMTEAAFHEFTRGGLTDWKRDSEREMHEAAKVPLDV
jgi:hypothetical protein